MGKRSNFERVERDYYPTPRAAVRPLIPHIQNVGKFIEPCAGNGALIDHLEAAGLTCSGSMDIFPMRHDIRMGDAMKKTAFLQDGDHIITNPPWDRKILHPMIEHFSALRPTWLLFDADWMHTKQSAPYMEWCVKIVSVGRVKWFPDSKNTGMDNCAWYLFDVNKDSPTEFYGRTT